MALLCTLLAHCLTLNSRIMYSDGSTSTYKADFFKLFRNAILIFLSARLIISLILFMKYIYKRCFDVYLNKFENVAKKIVLNFIC